MCCKIIKGKLKDNPKSFHLEDGTYTCCVCHDSTDSTIGKISWYDKNGIKCIYCQKVVENGDISQSWFCNDRDSACYVAVE